MGRKIVVIICSIALVALFGYSVYTARRDGIGQAGGAASQSAQVKDKETAEKSTAEGGDAKGGDAAGEEGGKSSAGKGTGSGKSAEGGEAGKGAESGERRVRKTPPRPMVGNRKKTAPMKRAMSAPMW